MAVLMPVLVAAQRPGLRAQTGETATQSAESQSAAQPAAQPAAVEQFQHLEDSWSIALVNKDQYALENLLAPTFVDISAAAAVNTRNQSIADTLAGLPKPLLSVEQKVVNVRVVSDVAIVEGTYVMRLRDNERTRDQRGIFTHVYQRSRNSWSCVSAQQTAVVDQLESGKGRASAAPSRASGSSAGDPAAKKSSAALPFHIPLLYKGPESKTSEPAPASNPPQQPSTPPPTGNPQQ